jgi:nitroimidazol reductase NimA-like FMN-containing flavoprotein (pyridoxamine 5'-phosphate oxidase superfamily)
MPTVQGDLALLNEPVAQRLLQSRIPARLAYVWGDGTPRVVPIGFHCNGRELVLGTPPDAPKVKVLADGTPVAVTIDGDEMPHPVLMITSSANVSSVK